VRVVFIQYGLGNIELAEMMVASCKKHGYEVIQLSDEKAPRIGGISCLRAPMNEPRMLWRMRRLLEVEPPYVMLDTDMLVAKDISDGFGGDVALTWRARHMIFPFEEKKALRMPYNGGVIFVSNQDFIKECLKEMEAQEPRYQDWYGDQLALVKVAESGRFKVKELRDEKWNFVPDSNGHEIPDIRIWHYKGMRKAMMPARFKTL
jgi:hypothetical protein